jgi:hypothetical protein
MDAADRARIGARGLADAEAQAAAVGASFAVQSTAGGTSARFEWVASGAS